MWLPRPIYSLYVSQNAPFEVFFWGWGWPKHPPLHRSWLQWPNCSAPPLENSSPKFSPILINRRIFGIFRLTSYHWHPVHASEFMSLVTLVFCFLVLSPAYEAWFQKYIKFFFFINSHILNGEEGRGRGWSPLLAGTWIISLVWWNGEHVYLCYFYCSFIIIYTWLVEQCKHVMRRSAVSYTIEWNDTGEMNYAVKSLLSEMRVVGRGGEWCRREEKVGGQEEILIVEEVCARKQVNKP